MRKEWFIILISFSLIENAFSQEVATNHRINVGNITHEWYVNNIFFKPLNENANKPIINLCNIYKEKFYLNGLQLDNEQFINLRLLPRHLSNDSTTAFTHRSSKQGYGTYEYRYEKGEGCAYEIIYKIKTKLPIILNGIELSMDKQEATLSKIVTAEILSIERKNSLFGYGEIRITTKP